jgi:hypothetical protein
MEHEGQKDLKSTKWIKGKNGTGEKKIPMVSLKFFIDIMFRSHDGPGVDSASNRNQYQESFLGR